MRIRNPFDEWLDTLFPYQMFGLAGGLMFFYGIPLLEFLATFSLVHSIATTLLTFSAFGLGLGTFLIPSVLLLWKRALFPNMQNAAVAHAATKAGVSAPEEMEPMRDLRFKVAELSPASLGSKPLSASADALLHKSNTLSLRQ